MSYAPTADDPSPIMAMNTTPLIDVMLVLLIMFIVTIPIRTHAVKVDLPAKRPLVVQPDPIRNVVVVTQAGAILWNGTPLTRDQLAASLAATAAMAPQPELHLSPEARARYALVDEILAMTKRARVERVGFVGNERYAAF